MKPAPMGAEKGTATTTPPTVITRLERWTPELRARNSPPVSRERSRRQNRNSKELSELVLNSDRNSRSQSPPDASVRKEVVRSPPMPRPTRDKRNRLTVHAVTDFLAKNDLLSEGNRPKLTEHLRATATPDTALSDEPGAWYFPPEALPLPRSPVARRVRVLPARARGRPSRVSLAEVTHWLDQRGLSPPELPAYFESHPLPRARHPSPLPGGE